MSDSVALSSSAIPGDLVLSIAQKLNKITAIPAAFRCISAIARLADGAIRPIQQDRAFVLLPICSFRFILKIQQSPIHGIRIDLCFSEGYRELLLANDEVRTNG